MATMSEVSTLRDSFLVDESTYAEIDAGGEAMGAASPLPPAAGRQEMIADLEARTALVDDAHARLATLADLYYNRVRPMAAAEVVAPLQQADPATEARLRARIVDLETALAAAATAASAAEPPSPAAQRAPRELVEVAHTLNDVEDRVRTIQALYDDVHRAVPPPPPPAANAGPSDNDLSAITDTLAHVEDRVRRLHTLYADVHGTSAARAAAAEAALRDRLEAVPSDLPPSSDALEPALREELSARRAILDDLESQLQAMSATYADLHATHRAALSDSFATPVAATAAAGAAADASDDAIRELVAERDVVLSDMETQVEALSRRYAEIRRLASPSSRDSSMDTSIGALGCWCVPLMWGF